METFDLTASQEDYLETIKLLVEETEHGHAHTSDIARRLKVKMPSVTNALGVLRKRGLIHYDTNKPVTLTPRGDREAARVLRRHRALSRFLREILLLDEDWASRTACRVEHVIDDRLLGRLEALTNAFTGAARHAVARNRLVAAYAAADAAWASDAQAPADQEEEV